MSSEVEAIRTETADVPHVAVVIPIKNEEKIISDTVEDVLRTLSRPDIRLSVVCVDDGSTDQTWAILKEMADRLPQVLGVRLSRNFGHDPALFAGIRVIDADAVITMDADGQHPCAVASAMIDVWFKSGCNIVHGVKRHRGTERARYTFAVGAFSRILSATLEQDLANATEFKLLDRSAVKALLGCGDQNVFYRALAAWIGFQQQEVEFDVAPSTRGFSHWNLGSLTKFAVNGLVTFSDLPIKVLFMLGVASILGSALMMVKFAFDFFTVQIQPGYSTLLILMLLNLGFVMVGLGVIGLYVRTTMLQSLGRPRSIVQEVYGRALARP